MADIHSEKLANMFFKIYRESIFFPYDHRGKFHGGEIYKYRKGIFENTEMNFELRNYQIKLEARKNIERYSLSQFPNLEVIHHIQVYIKKTRVLSFQALVKRDCRHYITIESYTFGPWVAILNRPSSQTAASVTKKTSKVIPTPPKRSAVQRNHLRLVQ